MTALHPNKIALCALVCIALAQLPQVQNLGQRLKSPASEGQRVCVAVGEKKVVYKFSVHAPRGVVTDGLDSAKVSVDVEPESVNDILRVEGLKPGKIIAHVTQQRRLPGNKPEDFDRWFIITVTAKPTTDKCLCEGSGEIDCTNPKGGNGNDNRLAANNSNTA